MGDKRILEAIDVRYSGLSTHNCCLSCGGAVRKDQGLILADASGRDRGVGVAQALENGNLFGSGHDP